MNNEIKEILSKDNIHIIECDENWCNAYGYEKSQLKEDLLDYITNLQEEKDKYKDVIDRIKKYAKANKIIEIIALLEVEEVE